MSQKEMDFPNGFDSWYETHHEVVSFMTNILRDRSEIPQDDTSVIWDEVDSGGTGRLYELAKEWTDEFEQKNKGRKWDGEFFDEIWEFCNRKNNNI